MGLLVVSASGQPMVSAPNRAEAVTRRNSDVLRALHLYEDGGTPSVDALKRASVQRQAEMQGLISTDPGAVLDSALPDDVRSAFPEQVQGLIEQHVDVEGEIEVTVEDGIDYSRTHFNLIVAGNRLEIYFAGAQAENLVSGTHMRLQGVRVGQSIATTAASLRISQAVASATTAVPILSGTFGAQKILAILVNFQDEALQPVDTSYVNGLLFGSTQSVSAWWQENSFQQTSATGTVAGWYTIPVSSTTCNTASIATYANSAAQSAGYVLSNYTHLVYIFPNNACSWWGYSTIGGSPSQSWIRDYTNSTSGVALMNLTHELGHSLGLSHSHGWNCTANPSTSCSSNEYGDTLDVMGNIDYVSTPHYDSFQKERLGWLNNAAQPPIQTASTSGTYVLAPYETQDTGVKAIKVAQSNGAYYYLEYRTATGFDSFLSGNSNVLNGVVLHLATPGNGNSSELLNIPSPSAETMTPALDAGQSFTDSTAGITVAPVSIGSTAGVQITLTPAVCVNASPSISVVSPSTSVVPGTTSTLAVTVTNNNGSNCPSSTFSLSSSVPSGWSAAYSATSLTLAPGTSGKASLSVAAPAGSANGTYTIAVGASNTSATSYVASASVTETLYTPPPVTVSVTTGQSSYIPGQKISTTVTVMSGTKPVSGANVSAQLIKSDGSVVSMNGTTGSSGSVVMTYQSKKNDPKGNWNDSGSYSGNAAKTSFMVQ